MRSDLAHETRPADEEFLWGYQLIQLGCTQLLERDDYHFGMNEVKKFASKEENGEKENRRVHIVRRREASGSIAEVMPPVRNGCGTECTATKTAGQTANNVYRPREKYETRGRCCTWSVSPTRYNKSDIWFFKSRMVCQDKERLLLQRAITLSLKFSFSYFYNQNMELSDFIST